MSEVRPVQLSEIRPYNYALYRIRSGKSWTYPRHRHRDVFEFYYLFGGELLHTLDAGRIQMREGDFVSIAEEEYHSLSGRNFDFFNLILPLPYWTGILEMPGMEKAFGWTAGAEQGNRRISTCFRGSRQVWITEQLEQLFLYQKSEYGDLLLGGFLMNLAAELMGPPEGAGEASDEYPLWLKDLIMEVENRMAVEVLTLTDLVRLSSRSAEHLARTFRRCLGTTPSSWLNSLKLEHAALMLEHSNTAVLDIALSLGFENLGYFYRLFKENYGVPPVAYRKERGLF